VESGRDFVHLNPKRHIWQQLHLFLVPIEASLFIINRAGTVRSVKFEALTARFLVFRLLYSKRSY
jgi:hypothetical protein